MQIDKKLLRRLFLLAAGCLVFAWILLDTEQASSAAKSLWNLISPFVAGAVIAFVFNVPMRAIERQLDGIHKEGLRRVLSIVLTIAALLPALLCLLCDWRINGTLVWSGYAAGAIALLYVVILLPMWFRRPNPVIFVPVDFIAVGLYLLYINFATGGHWFLSFAFPVTGAIGLLISAAVALTHYLRGGYLYIYGGMLILGGGLAVLIEFLINLTFQIHETLFWSFYPMVAGIVLGLMLIVIAICKPLRESLHRKFFL